MDVFESIYRRNAWDGIDSFSGSGSEFVPTRRLAHAIATLVAEMGISSVLSVACGDDNWLPGLPGFIGVDVSPTAIERARAKHPERDYRVADARRDELPECDLVIVRDVIQHLSFADALAFLENVKASRPKWMLVSTYLDGANVDIETGRRAYRPDMTLDPFGWEAPLALLLDGYRTAELEDRPTRDPLKCMGLWRR